METGGLKRFRQFFRERATWTPAVARGFLGDTLLAPAGRPLIYSGMSRGGWSGAATSSGTRVSGRTMTRYAGLSHTARMAGGAAARSARAARRAHLPSWFGWLSGVGTKQPVLERRTIKTADDGVHFFRVRRFDKREAFRLLRFGIADYLNCVRDQVLGTEPASDVVRSHPSGQVAQKDGKTHSMVIFDSIRWGFFLRGDRENIFMLPQSATRVNRNQVPS